MINMDTIENFVYKNSTRRMWYYQRWVIKGDVILEKYCVKVSGKNDDSRLEYIPTVIDDQKIVTLKDVEPYIKEFSELFSRTK